MGYSWCEDNDRTDRLSTAALHDCNPYVCNLASLGTAWYRDRDRDRDRDRNRRHRIGINN